MATFGAGSVRGLGRAARITVPSVPLNFSAVGQIGQSSSPTAAMIFNAPADNGGTPITGYQVENTSTGAQTAITASGQSVGMSLNTTQNFRIRAVNAVGVSEWTSADSATNYRSSHGGENGYYSAYTVYVNVPTGVTLNYYIASGSGSPTKSDDRVYGTETRVYCYAWYDNYGTNYGGNWMSGLYHPWPGGYSFAGQFGGPADGNGVGHMAIGNAAYSWYGYDPNWNYLYGTYVYAGFSNQSDSGYYRIEATNSSSYWGWSGGTWIGGWYQSGSTFQNQYIISGSAGHPADYGAQSLIYNNGASTLIAQTGQGFNGSADTRTGSFTVVGTQIYLTLGNAYVNYSPDNHGPSGRATIWYAS
jgi:hypothetical protein